MILHGLCVLMQVYVFKPVACGLIAVSVLRASNLSSSPRSIVGIEGCVGIAATDLAPSRGQKEDVDTVSNISNIADVIASYS